MHLIWFSDDFWLLLLIVSLLRVVLQVRYSQCRSEGLDLRAGFMWGFGDYSGMPGLEFLQSSVYGEP